tara:strand:- start:268 stop:633 length:366 start_codon:yes stop_codon:yes gene_type:complete
MTRYTAHQINSLADALCAVTHEYLWTPRAQWAEKRTPGVNLVFRAGSGNATYVSHKKENPRDFTMTFGRKMVESALTPDCMGGWTHTREIKDRGYFQGEVNALNSLSAVSMHEFRMSSKLY